MEEYFKELERLKNLGREWNLSEKEIQEILDKSYVLLERPKPKKSQVVGCSILNYVKKSIVVSVIFIVICSCVVLYRKPLHNLIERNIHEVIYPGMKLLRKIMLPVILTFPTLTEWYDEACLVGNPYFQVSDIDCWPCENVRSVLNLTSSNLMSQEYHSGIPFILKDLRMKEVSFEELAKMYLNNQAMFDKDAPRIIDNSGQFRTLKDFFIDQPLNGYPSENMDVHVSWKLNRLEPTRAIRTLFGIPHQLPNFVAGATPEKHVLIDEAFVPPYQLPSTEGTNVFIVQASGSRLIVLDPSPECQQFCHRVSILLPVNHILWFNWWYWRPSSYPTGNDSGISITYYSSYY